MGTNSFDPAQGRAYEPLVIIKPDAFDRRLVGAIISELEEFDITQMWMTTLCRRGCDLHYAEHIGKPFYEGLVAHMTSGPVMAVIVQSDWSVVREKAMLIRMHNVNGTTPGPRNLIHCGDSAEAAKREVWMWVGNPLFC